MRLPDRVADLLIDRQAYRICPLVRMSDFVQLCRDRNISAGPERLRKLEQLGLFYPVARIYRPDEVFKVEYVEGGTRYRDLGLIKDGEVWEGDTRTRLAGFDFTERVVRSWREYEYLWEPRHDSPEHANSVETEARRHEAFYSQFQVYELDDLVSWLSPTVETEWAIGDDGNPVPEWGEKLQENLTQVAVRVFNARLHPNFRQVLGSLCQVISDRYFPKAQTDERHITIPSGGRMFRQWDWYEYARNWDAREITDLFEFSQEELRELYRRAARFHRHSDPLEAWRALVRFISKDKRKKLKGDALKAQTVWEMLEMIRLLHSDAFGENLEPVNEVGSTIIHRVPDVSPADDPLRALELVANDFGINPKAKAVLFVEGLTEADTIPTIFDLLYATSLSIYGIELVNVRGVSNATGGKDSSFSALWRLIDYLHHHQTVAFVLLDNEGLATRNVRIGLPRAGSIHFPDRRATRADYVKVWKLSFELDNFNNSELAQALTAYADGKGTFSASDVAQCRASASDPRKNAKVYTIDSLYVARTGERLNKPAFGRALVRLMFDPLTKRKPTNRPISRFLEKVAQTAALNHQPVTQTMWEYNQRTGHLGTLRPGAVFRRKDPFGRSAPRRGRKSKAPST